MLEGAGEALWLTLSRRWYAVGFFAAYLLAAVRHLGWRRTAALTVVGYLTAWASEACSIRTGFPYGWYAYLWQPAEPLGLDPREPALWGVPCFDSLSYVFIAYASLAMALYVLGVPPGRRTAPAVTLATAVLFVTVDVVIDPVALRGERWFLGKIYTYPGGGAHFGVPLSNYAGWLLVGAVIAGAFQLLDRWLGPPGGRGRRAGPGAGALLYLAVHAFGIGVAWWIGERELALASLGIALPLAALVAARRALGEPPAAGAGAA
ncbi:MAG: membrane protein [Planctomycetota bacterium]|nr:MAG: membrane protein [Planctomycetota bacterium]